MNDVCRLFLPISRSLHMFSRCVMVFDLVLIHSFTPVQPAQYR